ncbi:MAG TPA: class I SAM-dependent methyltransferase [Ktedonobacterales bacterium]|nr:class I SAM-dependent methyltransferase [Ktedonobacterales bacterium]
MRLGAIPRGVVERIAFALGLVPTPLLDSIIALLLARTVMVATRLGVFETMAGQPRRVEDIAEQCQTAPAATHKLLDALVGAGYLRLRGGLYSLAPVARRWLLKDSPWSLHDAILMQFMDEQFIAQMESFVRTGAPIEIHEHMTPETWEIYQRGMRSGARLATPEVALRLPAPRDARAMLDIGGSHGYYSVALCRRHPELRATVLDLPEAVTAAAPLLAREGMGDRVVHRADNALTADLGHDEYDLILIANLVHHFTAAQNRDLVLRCARALRPGGRLVIGEVVRPETPQTAGQIGALTDLYFALTSAGGTWSYAEMADWQRAAGLRPRRPIRLVTGPGGGLQVAEKPRS